MFPGLRLSQVNHGYFPVQGLKYAVFHRKQRNITRNQSAPMKSMRIIPLLSLLMFSIINGSAIAAEKHIYGLHETVYIAELGIELPAKLDTGAVTSSLSAKNIELYTQDGQPWVKFDLAVEDMPGISLELPVVRTSRIKRRADDAKPDQPNYSERPVVVLGIAMGDQIINTQVNLTDRSHFQFPVLLGATSLKQFNALVDAGSKYQAGSPTHNPEASR